MAKGRWLKRQGRKMASFCDNTIDNLVDNIQDKLADGDFGPALQSLTHAGMNCGRLARETSELCATTQEKGTAMMALGDELKSTLADFEGTMDANALETISNLIDGDHVAEAKTICTDISEQAKKCVISSVEMLDLMENSLDTLPPIVQRAMDNAFDTDDDDDDDDDEDAEDGEITRDLQDVERCITSIKELNLVTAMEVGLQVFGQLSQKANRSREMFGSIQSFSNDVVELTQAFEDMNARALLQKVRDMWKCLKFADDMRIIAQAVGKLMALVIDLFRESSTRLAGLWSALAFCKDCITECGDHVSEARAIVTTAQTDSLALVETTRAIKDNLDDLTEIENPRDVKRVMGVLAKSGSKDIKLAIDIAERMDDQVVLCVQKTMLLIDKVTEGYHNLPPICTEGISVEEDGKSEEDATPPDISSDIEELSVARGAIEEASVFGAAKASARGMRGVASKSINCKDMLEVVQEFVQQCVVTIDCFMGPWDLQSATDKIKEMCRLVNLGKLMKQFASDVKQLLLGMIALLKAAIDKFGDVLSDIKDRMEDRLDDVKDRMEDRLDDAKEKMEKLCFWK